MDFSAQDMQGFTVIRKMDTTHLTKISESRENEMIRKIQIKDSDEEFEEEREHQQPYSVLV